MARLRAKSRSSGEARHCQRADRGPGKSIGAAGGDVPQERRTEHETAVNELIEKWAPRVGVDRACRAFGVHPRTWRHRRQKEAGTLPERRSRAKPAGEKRSHPAKIDDATRTEIRTVLCERRCDLAPPGMRDVDEGVSRRCQRCTGFSR